MPHARFSELTRGHSKLMGDEFMAIFRQLRNTNWHSKERPSLRQAEREINEASDHASRMEGDIEYILDLLTDTVTPRSKRWSAQYAAKTEARKLRSRLQRYPLGGFADAGLTIVVDDILNNLESDMIPPEARAFLQDISCISPRSSIKDPSGSALPTLADPESRVLHLPILLVWHQIHDCGLDDLTQNRKRLNCVSAVQFLATLGIKDFPVYGLATSGQYGYVSSTWFSSADNVRHLCPCANITGPHRYLVHLHRRPQYCVPVRSVRRRHGPVRGFPLGTTPACRRTQGAVQWHPRAARRAHAHGGWARVTKMDVALTIG